MQPGVTVLHNSRMSADCKFIADKRGLVSVQISV